VILSSSLVPEAYKIADVTVFVPIGMMIASHILWPFALNPWFLSFSVSSISRGNGFPADEAIVLVLALLEWF
jgi:hypothetical protein